MLPDRSVLIGQKLVENAKIQKLKCDILGDFQTLCKGFKHSWQLWSGPLALGNHVMVFLNRYDHALTNVTFNLYADAKIPLGSYLVSDLWTSEEMEMEGQSDLTIPFIQPHAVLALRFEFQK